MRSGHCIFMMLSRFEDIFGGTIDLITRTVGLNEDCCHTEEKTDEMRKGEMALMLYMDVRST